MANKLTQIRDRLTAILWASRTRKTVIWLLAIIAGYGILLGLIAPPLLRGKIAEALTDKLHRQVSIGQIRINPYTMVLVVRRFLVKERQSQTTALSFDELLVNLQAQSLLRLAPVIKELRLVKPYVNVVRNEDLKYSFQDLLDQSAAGPAGPTPRFALNNIQVVDGKIDFDDRPEKTKHVIDQIKIGVPFISTFPSQVDIKVKPEFSAIINGSRFQLDGHTTPFKDTRETTLAINIDKLEIAKYLQYSPVTLNFTVPSGQLHSKINLKYTTYPERDDVLQVTGNLGVTELEMHQTDGATLLKIPSFDVMIDDIEVFSKKVYLKSIKVQSPELHTTRSRDGTLNLASLIGDPAQEPEPGDKKEGASFPYRVDEILVNQGKVFLADQTPERPFEKQLENINVGVKDLSNDPEKKTVVEISFESDKKEHFGAKGWLQITPLLAEVEISVNSFQLKGLRPYYESVVGLEIADGMMDIATRVELAQREDQTLETKLSSLNATLRSLRLNVPGESEPLWRAPLATIKETTVQIEKRSILVGSLESRDGYGFVSRNADGSISFARLIKTQAGDSVTKKPEQETETEWTVEVKRAALDRFRIVFEDRMPNPPVRTTVSAISVRGDNVSNVKNSRATVRFQATINDTGAIRLSGTLGTRPLAGRLDVDVQAVNMVAFQPYLADQINFSLTGGKVGSKGVLSFSAADENDTKLRYEGNVQLTEFASVEKQNSEDLLKWKSLALDALQFDLKPFQLRIGELTLADFYSRLILDSNGKMNLQKLTTPSEEQPVEAATAPAKPSGNLAPESAKEAAPAKAVSIGMIKLQNGNVNFSDFFIKPNYSANLTGVEGAISELKPETPGDLDLRAKLDNTAPVVIKGKINPLSKELFLDLVADAKEIALSPMTPYSVKYVGYGIEKGKLSFNVNYKVDNRKLSAENKIILNQLTFGEKNENPDATNLPVRLAVALLKDRDGVIDINLPVSGSLDDPQFSVGGIVLKLIFNIITKAVTAPFSLLGAAFGGSGSSSDELSYIEFESGRANINEAGQAKIATLAKALYNRPALNLELIGRVDPASDLPGLKRVALERKVKAQKLKDLVRRGQASKSLDEVQIDPNEYPQYLKAAYGEESFPKPRNFVGLARDLPVPEMEKLMLQHAKASDDDLRQLAQRRAQAVRDALLAAGQIDSARLFIVTAKPLSPEESAKTKGKPNRVDFMMK